MKKKIVYLIILSLLSVALLAGCGNNKNKNNPNYNSKNYLSGTHYALMEIKDFGKVYMELYADIAPATVTNFVNLVNEGFYNGLTFHRIIEGFMMQGGDPKGDGTGGSTYTVPGEFYFNGFETNTISHLRGALSMARGDSDNDSASSQFFIMHQDYNDLDGYYAAFGRVISGLNVIDDVCSSVKAEDDNGTVLSENQPVILSITMIEKDEMPPADIDVSKTGRPEPAADISFLTVNNIDSLQPKDRWIVDENGKNFLISSTEDLLNIRLYKIDLTAGVTLDSDNLLAFSSNLSAGDSIALQLNITTEGFPDQLLVAEESNGALSMYLLSYSSVDNQGYLVPFMR